MVKSICGAQRVSPSEEMSDVRPQALMAAVPLFGQCFHLCSQFPDWSFSISSTGKGLQRRGKRPRPELTSCFCWDAFRNVNDWINICSKFPFCIAEKCEQLHLQVEETHKQYRFPSFFLGSWWISKSCLRSNGGEFSLAQPSRKPLQFCLNLYLLKYLHNKKITKSMTTVHI